MHKKWLGLLAALLLLGLTACAKTEEGTSSSETPAPKAAVEVQYATLEIVTPTPVPTPEPTATPVPTPTPEPTATPFTIAWISDTQTMAQIHPDILACMRDYVLSVKEEQNIVALFHTGDVVDACGSQQQWDNVTYGLMPLVEELPTFMAAGNHDQAPDRGEYGKYSLFTRREMVQKAWEGMEAYKLQGEAGYRVLELEDDQILVAEEINKYPEATAIVVTHSAIFGDGSRTPDGNRIHWDILSKCPTVRLVVCGHERGITCRRTDEYDDDGDGTMDRQVTTLMCNFQEDTVNGLGYLRLLRFDPESRAVSVTTYSPWFDLYTYGDLPEEEMAFTLENGF